MGEMKYADIPGVNKKISRIFYGTASEPFQSGGDGNDLLDAIYETGVNAFDTARVYFEAERSLGNWISERGIRDKVVILTKGGHHTPLGRKRINERAIRKDLKTSLELLQTDYVDIYLLHRDDPKVEAGVIAEILNALHAEGKIGAFGGSNWSHRRIEEVNEYAYKHGLIPFTVSSPNFGLAEEVCDMWGGGSITISGPGNEDAREWYRQNQMPVVAYSSLGRGMFSGKVKSSEPEKAYLGMDEFAIKGYNCPANFERLRRCEILAEEKHCTVPQIAMAWIWSQGINTFALVNTSKPSRMQENIDALYIDLTPEESEYLDLKREREDL